MGHVTRDEDPEGHDVAAGLDEAVATGPDGADTPVDAMVPCGYEPGVDGGLFHVQV